MEKGSFVPGVSCDASGIQIFNNGVALYDENPLQRIIPFTLMRLCMFFIISQILRRFLKPLKQADYVCNLLTGIVLGPSVLGRYKDYASIKDMATHQLFQNFASYFGLIYYIFIIAVKTDTGMMFKASTKKV